ncbi:MAG: hypothetical protein OXQ96_04075, partial [Alphaproteobacteria bacterium]|nr:hypothetical protein [Alphaproteobacteria bacterium]
IELDELYNAKHFKTLSKIIADFCQVNQIDQVARCGVRFLFSLEGREPCEDRMEPFKELLAGIPGDFAPDSPNSISDFSTTIEGETEDKTGYRYIIGAFSKADILERALQQVAKPTEEYLEAKNFFASADLDFYEKDFNFADHGQSMAKWSTNKLKRVNDLATKLHEKVNL